MDASIQHMAGCHIGTDYPAPIVDDKLALKAAKDRMYGLRQTPAAREEAGEVQARHGSRKSGLPQTGNRRPAKPKRSTRSAQVPSAQGDLFT
jgi:deoxyribodipyrimidine photo-lyase